MGTVKILMVSFLLFGCAASYTVKQNGEKEYSFRVMQMAYMENHASAQSTVGLGFSLRFTDHSGAVTPKLDLGYFRHATGLDPLIYDEKKRLGSVMISTAADVTGKGITDEVSFGEATSYQAFSSDEKPSMFESMIGELAKMKESANNLEKAKYQNTIDFLKTVLGGLK